ncbi:MAG TPA: transglutaminase family protein [Balneolales bacterium]|nr:transglutaminase family protein [Balneolales bacterium]
MSKNSEIESLIFLLDDPDPFVKESVYNRLMDLGDQAIPLLDEYRVNSRDRIRKDAIEKVLHAITFRELEEEFMNLVDDGIDNLLDLEEATFLLARFDNPTLRVEPYQQKLDHLAGTIRSDIIYTYDSLDRMRILLHFVFYEEDFRGAETDYFHPHHSYIHKVIDRRTGIPLSLSFIVLFLSRRLDLRFYGVNLPMHFILKYENESEQIFLDPFHRGKIVSMNQCANFLRMNGIKPDTSYFQNASAPDMLARHIRNLIYSYEKRKDNVRASNLNKLLSYVELNYGKASPSDNDSEKPDDF